MLKQVLLAGSMAVLFSGCSFAQFVDRYNPFYNDPNQANTIENTQDTQNIQDEQELTATSDEVKYYEEPKPEVIPEPIKEEPKEPEYNETYNLLPFIGINVTNDAMNIATQFKLKKYFGLKDDNKLILDYIAKEGFLTKTQIIEGHNDFAQIKIGAHPKESFIRVVVQVKKDISNYNVKINPQGFITISEIK